MLQKTKNTLARIIRGLGLATLKYVDAKLAQNMEPFHRSLSIDEHNQVTYLERVHSRHGVLRSTQNWPDADKFDINQFFQYSDKAACAMSVATSWPGGDYMEFGSTDLNTFRNFLTAFNLFNLHETSPGTRFYGFDIFGDVEGRTGETAERIASSDGYGNYMNLFGRRGNLYQQNLDILKQHALYVDKCELVQGYFEEILTDARAQAYKQSGRRVGFACLDCNIAPPYKIVFEFLYQVIADYSFIYMDEYYSAPVIIYFDQFMEQLGRTRGLDARVVRNAGGFGALFYIFPRGHYDHMPRLDLK